MSQIVQAEESIRLYEFESSKPDLDEESLEHFGILGMHWGTRNGPPYPLSSKISTGRRLKGSGGGSGSVTRKRRKALKKARKARAKNLKIKTMEKQTKEDIIKRKDIKSMLQNVDKFTSQEINDMLSRLDVERRLAEKVREVERANTPAAKKIWKGMKESAKEGAARGGKEIIKTMSSNGIKMVSRKLLKEFGGNPNSEEGKRWNDIIDKLVGDKPISDKDEKKKKEAKK